MLEREPIVSLLEKLPEQVMSLDALDAEYKVAASIGLAVANVYAVLATSRCLEGTIYRKHEKALSIAGAIGVTAINAIINYNIWS